MSVQLILIVPALILGSMVLFEGISFVRTRMRSRADGDELREADVAAVERARQGGSFSMKAGPLPERGPSRDVDLYQVSPMSGGQGRNPNASPNRATDYVRGKRDRA